MMEALAPSAHAHRSMHMVATRKGRLQDNKSGQLTVADKHGLQCTDQLQCGAKSQSESWADACESQIMHVFSFQYLQNWS